MPAFGKIKKSFFFLFFFLFFNFCFPSLVFADTKVYHPTFEEILEQGYQDSQTPEGETPVNYLQVSSYQTDALMANTITKIAPVQYCPEGKRDPETGVCKEGAWWTPNKTTALGTVIQLMATLYSHPPASFVAYLYDRLENAGFVKPAYAQGLGFAGLTSFLPFWQASRNLAYLVLILVMVVIGFMIIFRMKIDPKTVISLQAALPKIVFSLILITFSYPIVGFLIDLMYLLMAFSIAFFVQAVGGDIGGADAANLQTAYLTANVADLFGAVFWPVRAILMGIIGILAPEGLVSGVLFTAAKFLHIVIAGVGLGWVGFIVALPGIIILLILVLGLFFTSIRLLLILLNSYIQLLIAVILGPIILLGEAIPGKNTFSQWLFNIIANLVVFPATALVLMFGVYLNVKGQTSGTSFALPFLGDPAGGNFHFLLGLGVMFMAPTLVVSIKKLFHPKPTLPITATTAMSPLTGTFQTALGALQHFYYAKPLVEKITGKGK